jgi:hypothetical protein
MNPVSELEELFRVSRTNALFRVPRTKAVEKNGQIWNCFVCHEPRH